MQTLILASFGWIFDVLFFAVLILRTVYGAHRGFIVEACKLAGKVASIIFAFMLCVSFSNFLESCFGMTSAIANRIASSIAKNEAYAAAFPIAIPSSELLDVLTEMGIGAIPRWFIAIGFSDVKMIPAGTTPALMIGSILAKWIAIVISFFLLIILIRLAVVFLSKLMTKVVDKLAPFRLLNQFLGALLGFAKACFLLFIALTVLSWLPMDSAFESSFLVGNIISSEWFRSATGYAISGKWFTDFLAAAK